MVATTVFETSEGKWCFQWKSTQIIDKAGGWGCAMRALAMLNRSRVSSLGMRSECMIPAISQHVRIHHTEVLRHFVGGRPTICTLQCDGSNNGSVDLRIYANRNLFATQHSCQRVPLQSRNVDPINVRRLRGVGFHQLRALSRGIQTSWFT